MTDAPSKSFAPICISPKTMSLLPQTPPDVCWLPGMVPGILLPAITGPAPAPLSSGANTWPWLSCGVTSVQLCILQGTDGSKRDRNGQGVCLWRAVPMFPKFPHGDKLPSGLPWKQLLVPKRVMGRQKMNQGLLVPRLSPTVRTGAQAAMVPTVRHGCDPL